MSQAQKKTAKPITPAQIRRIHTIKHYLGLADENYRACLDSRFGVTTCKELTVQQATSFISELEKLALETEEERFDAEQVAARQKSEAERPKRFDSLDNRPGFATAPQLRKIEAMWQDISIIPDHDARGRALRKFIKRVTGVADMRFLDGEGAGKVINAMVAMQKRGESSIKANSHKNAE